MVQRVVGAHAGTETVGLDEIPILGIRPLAGELRWFLDAAACP